jgi:hypothetical protein
MSYYGFGVIKSQSERDADAALRAEKERAERFHKAVVRIGESVKDMYAVMHPWSAKALLGLRS